VIWSPPRPGYCRPPALGVGRVRYQRTQTRNTKSSQAQELVALPNVRLLSAPDGYTVESPTQAFEGVELAFVNTDGFAVGGCLSLRLEEASSISYTAPWTLCTRIQAMILSTMLATTRGNHRLLVRSPFHGPESRH
jgi:hypothetical protein